MHNSLLIRQNFLDISWYNNELASFYSCKPRVANWSADTHIDNLLIRRIKQNKTKTKFNIRLKHFNPIKNRAFGTDKSEHV